MPPDRAVVIQKLLAEYHAHGYPGRYAFIAPSDPNGFLYVFPEGAANERGSMERQQALTNSKVAVTIREGQALIGVLQDVLKQLSRTAGSEVGLGGIAMNSMFQPAPGLQVKNTEEAAHLFFNRTASALKQSSWRVLWDPTLKFYLMVYFP